MTHTLRVYVHRGQLVRLLINDFVFRDPRHHLSKLHTSLLDE